MSTIDSLKTELNLDEQVLGNIEKLLSKVIALLENIKTNTAI